MLYGIFYIERRVDNGNRRRIYSIDQKQKSLPHLHILLVPESIHH